MANFRWIAAGVVAISATLVAAQQPARERLTFDVAVIRLSKPGQANGGIKPLDGGFGYTAQNVSVKLMISLMYGVPGRQITGGPEWLENERFDVEAKSEHAYGRDDLHLMFQHLLEDRLHLVIRKEVKEGNVYALLVDGAAPKMSVNTTAEDFHIPMTFGDNGVVIGDRVSMPYLAWWLGLQLQRDERPVVDMTGLKGNYNFRLSFAPERTPDAGALPQDADKPSLFNALKDQLGLKLLPRRGPVTYFVVEHIEKPSDN